MQSNVVRFEDEAPTKPVNDGPALLRIRWIAALAVGRALDSTATATATEAP